jgi:hypothetical protein
MVAESIKYRDILKSNLEEQRKFERINRCRMERDSELGDTVLHKGGYIIRDSVMEPSRRPEG